MPGPADEFVPYRDSVDGADETQVLLQQDAEAAAASAGGSAGPGTPSMQDERIPSHFTIQQAIAASWILFVPSAISLLFGVVTAIMYATDPDNFDLDWETTLALQILALLVSPFVPPPPHLHVVDAAPILDIASWSTMSPSDPLRQGSACLGKKAWWPFG